MDSSTDSLPRGPFRHANEHRRTWILPRIRPASTVSSLLCGMCGTPVSPLHDAHSPIVGWRWRNCVKRMARRGLELGSFAKGPKPRLRDGGPGKLDCSALLYDPFPALGPQPTSPPPLCLSSVSAALSAPKRSQLMLPAQPNTS